MKLLVLFSLVCLALAEKSRYDNYKVVRINVENAKHVKVLQELENLNNGYNFLSSVMGPGDAEVVVPPHKLAEFEEIANKLNIKTKILSENLQKDIDNEGVAKKGDAFGWTAYYTLDDIYGWIDDLVAQYPGIVTTFNVGQSYEGRQLKGIKISYKSGNKGIFIETNIHAREWISSATSTWIVNELLTSTDPAVRDIAENIDWWVLPIANPDGFVYSHTNTRLWRKTRQPVSSLCNGADPNRNFDFYWLSGGSSTQPCSDTYAGARAFSEPETKALADFYRTIAANITGYIDFHSYSQLLMYPYSTTAAGRISNEQEHITVGSAMTRKIQERYGTQYKFGDVVTTIYVASGGSIDWVKGVIDTPFVFVYELRDTGLHGFVLPADQIIPTAEETFDSILEFVKEARKIGYFPV